jgi:hypothetical protein
MTFPEAKLYMSPNTKQFHRILNVGTGTGDWAIEFGMLGFLFIYAIAYHIIAEEHPEAKVVGTDLSLIQPEL